MCYYERVVDGDADAAPEGLAEPDEALWQARAKYEALIEHVPAIVYEDLPDDEFRTTYVSPQIESILGLSQNECVSDPTLWERHLHPEDRERAITVYREAIEAGRSGAQEYRMLRPDGRVVWTQDQFTVIRDYDDTPRLIQGVMFDVTQRKEMERRLGEAEAKYHALVEQVPAILYIDLPEPEFETLYVSPQLEEILGITPEDWINSDEDLWTRHLHPDDRDRVLKDYRDFLAGRGHVGDYRMERPDGKVVWIRDRARLMRDVDGRVVEQGVMFDVTELKMAQEIITRQVDLLQKADAIGRGFTRLLLRDAGLKPILAELADVAQNPVALEDPAHQLVALTGALPSGVLDDWEAHSRAGHSESDGGVTVAREIVPECAWTPIWLRDEEWGRLHLLQVTHPIDEIDLLAVDRAAVAVGLAQLSEREAASLADNAGSALLFDVLEGRQTSAEELFRRARNLGAELAGRTLAATVVELPGLSEWAAERSLSECDRHQLRSRILREVRSAAAAAECSALVGFQGERVLAILGIRAGRNSRETLDGMGNGLSRLLLGEQLPNIDPVVGIAEETKPEALRQALERAIETAAYGARAGLGGTHYFRDLGVHYLLARLSEGPVLARFVEAELQPLLEHDAKGGSQLIPTLQAYLDRGAVKAPTAAALHIQRRSLYHRLERIQEILGRDLSDPETRLRLHVALRSLALLRGRAGSTQNT
ncbi:MAG: PAS domain-containing protein [Actinomycetota bacterium]